MCQLLTPAELGEAVEAAEFFAELCCLEKARSLDPLNGRDFLTIIARIRKQIEGLTAADQEAAMRTAIQTLDVDWVNLSDEARQAVVLASRKALGDVVPKIMPRVQEVFTARGRKLVADTKRRTAQKFKLDIRAAVDRKDENVATTLSQSATYYVRDRYGTISEALGNKARIIVAQGLEDGLGSGEISAKLAAAMPPRPLMTGYWDIVVQAFATRARTYTQLFAFDKAGIEAWMFEAVLDEVTTDQCRFMHGTVFPTKQAIDKADRALSSDDPEAVKWHQPWLQIGKNSRGEPGMYYKDLDGQRHYVAQIDDTGVGVSDKIGKYSQSSGEKSALEAVGIWMPPLHGRCRSTIVPK